MKPFAISLALVLALVALTLPVRGLAAHLAGGSGVVEGTLITGVWLLKGILLTLALLALAAWRTGPWHSVERPLATPLPIARSTREPVWQLALGITLLVAALLRLSHLGGGLWFDEIQTLVDYVRYPLSHILSTYDSQNNHLFYSLLAKLSVMTFGEGAFALRLPAAVLGVLSIWALFEFGRRVTSQREAFLATALLTVSYHHVWFSQNARGYTGLLLGTLVGTAAFLRLVSTAQPTWRAILWYGLSMALAIYVHLTAVLVVAAHAVIWVVLVWQHRRDATRAAVLPTLWALALAGSFSLALYALVLPQLVGTLLGSGGPSHATQWQNPIWLLTESLRGLSRGFPGGPAILVMGLVVAVSGWVSFWRRSPTVAVLMVLPAVLTAAAAVVLSHNLWPRLFFFSAGFGVLIAIRGMFAISDALVPARASAIAAGLASTVVLLSALTVPRAWGPKQDFAGAAELVETSFGSNDAVVTVDLTNYPYREFLNRSWDSVASIEALRTIEQSHTRTWVLYTFPVRLSTVQPDIWHHLQTSYDTAAVFPGTVGGGSVVVMVTR
jgi:mannosyltransferase